MDSILRGSKTYKDEEKRKMKGRGMIGSPGTGKHKRILREIADVQCQQMRDLGIYYFYDDADILRGRALILGPEGTPYGFCPLVFEIQFGSTYPFDPPSVRILTSDGRTRFHPNLYVDGKVCLSILGTWSGPKWSAVMNIRTVLTSILSLLERNPLVNEPGYETLTLETSEKAKQYAELVRFRLLLHSLREYNTWKCGVLESSWRGFEDALEEKEEELLKAWEEIFARRVEEGDCEYTNVPYSMQGKTNWTALKDKLAALRSLNVPPA